MSDREPTLTDLAYGNLDDDVPIYYEGFKPSGKRDKLIRATKLGATVKREVVEAILRAPRDWLAKDPLAHCGLGSAYYLDECITELDGLIECAEDALAEAERCHHGVAHDLMICRRCEREVLDASARRQEAEIVADFLGACPEGSGS